MTAGRRRIVVSPSPGGDLVEVAVAAIWILRAITDRALRQYVRPRMTDFDAVLDCDLRLWVSPRGTPAFGRSARGVGADLDVLADVTRGVVHAVSVRVKPGDSESARWSCSCGAAQRGSAVLSPERAGSDGEAHASGARDSVPRPVDQAVDQEGTSSWSLREIRAVRRFHAALCNDSGTSSDYELVVDGRLGLWVRQLGAQAALRKDQDARGVSLLVLDSA